MMGLLICIVAFAATLGAATQSILNGLRVLFIVGYFYGIVRANFFDSFTHFIFDGAVLGFYLAIASRLVFKPRDPELQQFQRWVGILLAWPILVSLLPIQDYLVQLVGLRGNAYFVPFMLVGCLLSREDAFRLAIFFAVMNLIVLGFAVGEVLLGVERFYPDNPSTDLIYRSRDVVTDEGRTLRIPGTFTHAHSFAGTVMGTIPWLVGAMMLRERSHSQRLLLVAGVVAAILCAMFSATRSWIPQFTLMVFVIAIYSQIRSGVILGFVILIGGTFYLTFGEDRLQRFTTLSDSELILNRLGGSVNLSFFDLLEQYPLGNGMGGGGTSLPFFLQGRLRNPVIMENEYSRILLEQGLPGLMIWLAFIIWLVFRPRRRIDSWDLGRTILWYSILLSFVMSVMGIGLMAAIPGSALFFLNLGFIFSGRFRPIRIQPNRPMQEMGST